MTRNDTYLVIVGGWRTAGAFDTLEQAQERAKTCLSRHVDIIEINEETQIVHDVPSRLSGLAESDAQGIVVEVNDG